MLKLNLEIIYTAEDLAKPISHIVAVDITTSHGNLLAKQAFRAIVSYIF
jgi:hypothetical protein